MSASLDHICIMVNDLQKALDSFGALPEAGPWVVEEADFSKGVYEVGKIYKVKFAFGKILGIDIEIAQPVPDPDDPKAGDPVIEGLHHMAYRFPTEQEMEDAAEKLKEKGYEVSLKCRIVRRKGTPKEHGFKCYHFNSPAGGMLIEFGVYLPVEKQDGVVKA
jgi:catechol 2,3-dioxygenase-like lactoylglutathione lyase family enzyme